MSLSITRMRGECLVVASLQGFSDEALEAELQRRSKTRRDAGKASPPSSPPNWGPGARAQEDFNNGRAEILDVIALSDFDSCSLVDELQLRPNFKLMLQERFGLTLLTTEEMRSLTEACAQGSIERIRQAFKWPQQPNSALVTPAHCESAPSS